MRSWESSCDDQPPAPTPPLPIGGDKDKHGCLIGAGESWCESEGKCVQEWKDSCNPTPSPPPSPSGDKTNYTTGIFKGLPGGESVELRNLDTMDDSTSRQGKWKLSVSKSDDGDLTIHFKDDANRHMGIMYATADDKHGKSFKIVSGEYARETKGNGVSARRMLLGRGSDSRVHYKCDSVGKGTAKCNEKDDWHGWGHWKGGGGGGIVSAITGIADAAQKTVVNYGIDVTESAINGGKCPAGACQEDWSENDK